MNFITLTGDPIAVSVGDIVRVEADRGIDAGTVVAKVPVHEFKAEPHTAGFRGRGFKHTDDQRIRYIVSLADEEDKKRLINKTEEEGLVLQVPFQITIDLPEILTNQSFLYPPYYRKCERWYSRGLSACPSSMWSTSSTITSSQSSSRQINALTSEIL
jgi:hypothetical protein